MNTLFLVQREGFGVVLADNPNLRVEDPRLFGPLVVEPVAHPVRLQIRLSPKNGPRCGARCSVLYLVFRLHRRVPGASSELQVVRNRAAPRKLKLLSELPVPG